MPEFSDALRGYAFAVHRRDGFRCCYCGLDGTKSFATWATLSWDHLLPKDHPNRDNTDYIVTACRFCNTADNRYFDSLTGRGLSLDNLSREQLISQRKRFVEVTRKHYKEFWRQHVRSARKI